MKFFASVIAEREIRGKPHYLLLHFKDGRGWRFVGGKFDTIKGESGCNCAIREFREEVGVELDTADLSFMGHRFIHIDGDDWLGYFFSTSKMVKPCIMEKDKHDDLRWMTKSEIFRHSLALEYEMVSIL